MKFNVIISNARFLQLIVTSLAAVCASIAPSAAFAATFTGTSGNDAIIGTSSADTITMANGGFDYANGRDGNDKITKIDGGHTMLLGGRGSDTITLTTSINNNYMNAWIHGEQDNDIIKVYPYTEASNAFAEVFGGSGADILQASDMEANLHGGSGNDNIRASGGSYTIHGDGNDDTITITGDGIGTGYGDSGNDNLIANMGAITFYGGTGSDTFTSGADASAVFYGEAGADKFLCGSGNDAVMDFNPIEGDIVSSSCEIVNYAIVP